MPRGAVVQNVRALTLLGAFALSCAAARAQEPPVPPPAQPPVVAPPAGAEPPADPQAPAAAQAEPALATPATPLEAQRRREQIIYMEGVLAQAVRMGATATARAIQAVQPGIPLFTGTARAKGFFLEGYGVFFDVEIPAVQPSVAWIVETLERRQSPQPSPTSLTTEATIDPNASYTEAVKEKLIDAMLDYRIDLQPGQWLTVGARDGEGPAAPGVIYETITMILRIKGSDLADYRSGRIARDEARRRVEVGEF